MEVFIEIQGTPNPNALKFMLADNIITEGKATFNTHNECTHIPLAFALFGIKSVIQVHFFENIITVTKDDERNWDEVQDEVSEALNEHLPYHNPDFNDEMPQKNYDDLPPELKEINEILDRSVRPSLQMDGGDIEVLEYKDELLFVRYEGACGTCPSATSGTMMAIEGILRNEYNDNLSLVLV